MKIESYHNNYLDRIVKHLDSGIVEQQTFSLNGQLMYRAYLRDGHLHRKYGPALIWWSNGQIIRLEYWQDGTLHREGNFPALIWWFENGQLMRKEYWQDGNQHHKDTLGSATICLAPL